MQILARVAPLALVTLVGLPVAQAERNWETGRSEYTKCDSPAPYRDREHVSRDTSSVRPDAIGKQLVNPSREGDSFHPGSNVEVRLGKPELRPDVKREAFMPVDDTGRQRSAIDGNVEVSHGKPNLRQEPKRDAFMPARDGDKKATGMNSTLQTGHGQPQLRPDARRDAFMPTDESGKMRGVDATYDIARGRPAANPLRDMCRVADCE